MDGVLAVDRSSADQVEKLQQELASLSWEEVPQYAVKQAKEHQDRALQAWKGMIKPAYDPILRRLAEILNLAKGTYVFGIPNHPGILSSMITGGILGGGLGYGWGTITGRNLPEKERKRRRRILSLIGAASGAVPGTLMGLLNLASGNSFFDYPYRMSVGVIEERVPCGQVQQPHQGAGYGP